MAEETEKTQPVTPSLFETYPYSYQSKKTPGKPPVLAAMQGLWAPVRSGTDLNFGAVAV